MKGADGRQGLGQGSRRERALAGTPAGEVGPKFRGGDGAEALQVDSFAAMSLKEPQVGRNSIAIGSEGARTGAPLPGEK